MTNMKKTRIQPSVALLFSLAVAGLLMVSAVAAGEDMVYRLDSGDRIRVTVYGHEDLSGEFELDSEGKVSLPLIQDVTASGLSIGELEQAITDKLSPDFLRHPKVSIEVLNYRPFYILGEIKEPGGYAYVNGMTLVKAVALAGGYTYRARTSKVTITRTVDDSQLEIRATADTLVMPGDVIEVPERFF
jgi:polysaccharide export outer membrane protein